MKLTVEISMYPLADNFIPPIKDIIAGFNQYEQIEVITSATSTQLFGDYDLVMNAIQQELKRSFEAYGTSVFVTKFINGDVREL